MQGDAHSFWLHLLPLECMGAFAAGKCEARDLFMHAWRCSLGHISTRDKLVGGIACAELVFLRNTFAASLLWLFPSLHMLPCQSLKGAMRLSVIPTTHAAVVSSGTDSLLEVGMSSPLLASAYQAGAGFASLLPWQGAIPVGSGRLHWLCIVLPIPKP